MGIDESHEFDRTHKVAKVFSNGVGVFRPAFGRDHGFDHRESERSGFTPKLLNLCLFKKTYWVLLSELVPASR